VVTLRTTRLNIKKILRFAHSVHLRFFYVTHLRPYDQYSKIEAPFAQYYYLFNLNL
jgi:hypothetical protein